MLNKKRWSSAVWQILLVLFTLVFLSPMIYMVLNSFKPYSQMLKDPWGLPDTLFLDNYIKAFTQMKFFQSLYNSAVITIVSVFLIVVLGGLAAYPITRFDNRLTRFLSVYFLIGYMVPTQVLIVQIFSVMKKMHLINTKTGLILVYAAGVSFAVFMYQGFIRSMPVDMEESALIDGARPWQMFWKVVFPLLKPASATLIIFQTMWIWNDFVLSSLFLSSRKNLTLLLELHQCIGEFSLDWSVMLAIMCIVMFPMLVFYLLMQKQIISGMTAGAVKG
ncbi:carbohydrate ABC transporter membrane protein 2 (CUT1 family) [Hungatella effluvii]|uniref:Carbohydrate ABC transporter membrane protein 2 (CUT1 family) n=1 Tax=Hungatella effluvii TaxID=1096246 RepID=A0A2V3Y8V7_9FIRM|nr:carbohydrate ABC transporter permease [Hungatella effluvii]PXX55370.1 carbohydrate ABC transporter membrane protein 2 (CUT1 family) [Hungatella effluvii]